MAQVDRNAQLMLDNYGTNKLVTDYNSSTLKLTNCKNKEESKDKGDCDYLSYFNKLDLEILDIVNLNDTN